MFLVDPATARSHIAKIAELARLHPFLATDLEAISAVLDTAISDGVPPVGFPAVEQHGRLEISRVTYVGDNQPYVIIEWPEALVESPDIQELTELLQNHSVSSVVPDISPYSLIMIRLSAS